MGMDVYGIAPTSEAGEYFRNNVWWWRPLWDYCLTVAPDLCKDVSGHTNDGDGLNRDGALALARILFENINSGETAKFEKEYNKEISELPLDPCDLCNSTGIRGENDKFGIDLRDKELTTEQAIVLGRTHGWCNACDGVGKKPHWATNYPFTVENVEEFAKFLLECGGFQIC